MSQPDQAAANDDIWWLLLQVSAVSRRVAERRLAPAGVSPDQIQALRAIAAGQPLTVGDLARALGLERNSASQLVERLVRQRLVERERSTTDRRQVYVRVAPAGDATLQASAPLVRDLVAELLTDLTPSQVSDSARTLQHMRECAARLLLAGARESAWDGAAG